MVDSSALIAIALAEPEADTYFALLGATPSMIGAPSLLEVHMVLAKYSKRLGGDFLATVVADKDVWIEPFGLDLATIARAAFDRYGKGRHPAKLNFGDCMSYALAKARGLPLLYKGADFALTDIEPAFRP